jgi:hypothetical protein
LRAQHPLQEYNYDASTVRLSCRFETSGKLFSLPHCISLLRQTLLARFSADSDAQKFGWVSRRDLGLRNFMKKIFACAIGAIIDDASSEPR